MNRISSAKKKTITLCLLLSFFVHLWTGISFSMPSAVLDDLGNDIWASFLHDHSNSGYSSTMISSEPELLGKLQGMDKDDVFYGCVIYSGMVMANYTNWSNKTSGVVAFDLDYEEMLWSVELPERICFTPPVLNPTNGNIFVASTDGYYIRGSSSSTVSCIDVESGAMEWETTVDGAVFGPLVYFDNLLFYQNFYRDHADEAPRSDPGDIGCMDARTGSKKWIARMDYSFEQEGARNLFPAIMGKDILVPNTFGEYSGNSFVSAGNTCILYSFNTTTGRKNWEIRKENAGLPSVSVDGDTFYFTYTEQKGDNYTQKLEAYTSNRTLKWTYSLSSSVGWCSVPIYNDAYIFLRNRNGRVYCINKTDGKRVWNASSGYSSDASIYALNDHYMLTSFYNDETSYVKMFDLSRKTSRPIWEEEIRDYISQIALYQQTILLVGRNTIYTYWGDTPELEIDPSSLSASMEENKSSKLEITVTNAGGGELKGSLSTDTSWISMSPDSFTNDTTVTVTLNSRGLSLGTHRGSIAIKSNGGNKTIPVSLTVFKQDTSPPVLSISSPKNNEHTTEEQILVEGRVSDAESGMASLEVNDEELYVDDEGYFEFYYDLELGKNSLLLIATNGAGLITDRELTVYRDAPDSKPPTLTVYSPTPGQRVYEDTILVHGKATDEDSGLARVTVNGREVSVDRSGEFKTTVPLSMGSNTLKVEAEDQAGNTASKDMEVLREDQRLITIELWIGNRVALVDRNPIALDTPPIIYNGRTMVPVRFIAEAFGADIFYDAREQEINIAFGPTYISLWINRTRARVETVENGERVNRLVTLDAPPIIRSGRTLVPVRFIAEAFGATIDWNAREEKITIKLLVASAVPDTPPPPPPPPPSDSTINTRGNSLGNIVNFGLVAQQGEWIFYRNTSDGNKLYKIRTDNTNQTQLNDDISSYINVVGDWIYYRNGTDKGKIYKIRTDGTGRTKLNEDDSYYLNVLGENIYYNNSSDNGRLYKISCDGTIKKKLSGDNISDVNVVGDWIYFSNRNDGSALYKIQRDGTNRKKINWDNTSYINVDRDWIYYHNYSDGQKLYKIRIDGTGRMKLNDDASGCVNLDGDWIYYSNWNDEYKIYKIRKDGTSRTVLSNDSSNFLNIIFGWIYYINYSDSRKLYKIRTDGTERQEVK